MAYRMFGPALRSAHDHGTNLLFPHVIKTVVDCGFPGRRCGIDRLLRIQGFQYVPGCSA